MDIGITRGEIDHAASNHHPISRDPLRWMSDIGRTYRTFGLLPRSSRTGLFAFAGELKTLFARPPCSFSGNPAVLRLPKSFELIVDRSHHLSVSLVK